MSAGHEWPTVKLGDVLTPVRESEFFPNPGAERFVTVKLHGQGAVERGISAGKTPVAFTGFRIQAGQFIYSRIDARNGAFAIVPSELDGAVVSKDFPVFEINERRCSPRYLEHFARTGRLTANAKAFSQGATNRQRIKEKTLLRFKFPLPPLPEQRRIAGILGKASASVTSRQTLHFKMNELRDRSFNRFHTKHTQGSTPISFKDLVLQIENGRSPVCESREAEKDEWGILKLSAVTSGEFKSHENKALLQDSNALKNFEVHPGDLLMTRKNTPELVGAVALVRKTRGRLLLPDLIYRLRLNQELVEAEYFRALLMSAPVRARIRALAGGSSQSMSNISKQRLNQLVMSIPPLSDQREFVLQSEKIYRLQDRNTEALKLTQELHASLAARAFSGQL
ncbi:restriction endonuclease subunit S [Corynebacterium sp. HMSC28B08]|uniref:restriction endonuclease subunit S n=1 Tax=Corynebacterium sp. HMSC28B08 TaxID=1581066 RepID=UPI0008A18584|nr:restriction endonuclease subunit S [Corynebacterium sp. HMSC28B08]OFT88902.1 hypothetical protein HMPREF3098_06860 [Corynebacterium sp. HMSC28B08]